MNKVYLMLGLLVVLVAVGLLVNYDPTGKGHDRASATEAGQESKPPAVDPNRVHAIEIGDAENRIRVTRSGEKWVLPEKFNAPVMDAKVNDLLKAFQGLETAERVAKKGDKTFGLEPEAAKRVKLFDENNKLIADIWVGKPDMSGERTLQVAGNFVRIEGSDAVYSHGKRLQHLVLPVLSVWLDGRMFVLEPKELEDIVGKSERVVLEFDDVPFTPGTPQPTSRPETMPVPRARVVVQGKVKDVEPESAPVEVGPRQTPAPPKPPKPKSQKDWSLIEPADAGITPYGPFVDQIIRTLMYCRAEDVAGSDPSLPEYGFDHPFIDVDVQSTDGSARHLRIGKPAPPPTEPSRRGGSYRYATVDGVPRVFMVNEFVLPQFRKKAADLKQPETGRGAPPGGPPAPIELPKEGPESRK